MTKQPLCKHCSLPVVRVPILDDQGEHTGGGTWVHDATLMKSMARAANLQIAPAHTCNP